MSPGHPEAIARHVLEHVVRSPSAGGTEARPFHQRYQLVPGEVPWNGRGTQLSQQFFFFGHAIIRIRRT